MNEFRISKYNPVYRIKGIYTRNEWSSCAAILSINQPGAAAYVQHKKRLKGNMKGGSLLKRIMFIICIGMIVTIGILGAFYPKSDAISFDSAIFSERMEWFSSGEGTGTAADVFGGSERVLGYIGNAKEAAKKAEDLWAELYGEVERERKPYTVAHDKEKGVWMVQGGFHGQLGGRPFVLLRESDGKVLVVWHTV